jgi:hypothetical protein
MTPGRAIHEPGGSPGDPRRRAASQRTERARGCTRCAWQAGAQTKLPTPFSQRAPPFHNGPPLCEEELLPNKEERLPNLADPLPNKEELVLNKGERLPSLGDPLPNKEELLPNKGG